MKPPPFDYFAPTPLAPDRVLALIEDTPRYASPT
jgi:hypothetical protein